MLQNILQSLSDSKSAKKPSNAPSEVSAEAGEIFSELFWGAMKNKTKTSPLLSSLFVTKESPQTPAKAKNQPLMIPALPPKKALPSPLIPLTFQKGATLKELLEGAKSALPKGKEPWVEEFIKELKSTPPAPLITPKGEKNLAALGKIATALELNPLQIKAESSNPAKEALEVSTRLLEGKAKAKKGALLQSAKVAKEGSETPEESLVQGKGVKTKPLQSERGGAIPALVKPEVVKEVKTPEAKSLSSTPTPSLQAALQSTKNPAPLEAVSLEAPLVPSAPEKLQKGSPLSSALHQLASAKKTPQNAEAAQEPKEPSTTPKPSKGIKASAKREASEESSPLAPEAIKPQAKPATSPSLAPESQRREVELEKGNPKEEPRLAESRPIEVRPVESRLQESLSEVKKSAESAKEEGAREIKAPEESRLAPANSTESRQEILQKSALAKETLRHFSAALKEEVQNYKPPLTKLSLELNPEKLGSVELTITQRGQNLHVQVVSNPQAIQLFMNNAPEFRQQLANVGFSDVSMSFSDGASGGSFGGSGSHSGSHQPKGNENGLSAYKANALGGADLEESTLLSLMELTLPRYA